MKIKKLKDKQVSKILIEKEKMYGTAKAYRTMMILETKNLI